MALSKFKQSHIFNWYTMLWGIALVIAGYLAFTWRLEQNYIGIVERKTHLLGAQEPGRVIQMLVDIGDSVKQDQLLAMLDMTDLKTNLTQLKAELTTITQFEKAHRTRFSIEIQRMGLQLENEASDLIDRVSMIESQTTRLAGLNVEIERLKSAKEAGLGQNRDLADLVLERDALASLLKEQGKDLALQSRKLDKARKTRQELTAANIDSMSKSLFLEQMEYAEEIKRQIAEIEYRMGLRTIISPSDGFVTDLLARAGDVVAGFAPILTVEEVRPRFLTVYIPEKATVSPMPGMKVEIYSTRNRKHNTSGFVSFVHPGFVQANERLSFRGQLFWARKVRVELKAPHYFVPGEVVNARIKTKEKLEDYLSFASSASAQDTINQKNQKENPILKKMEVPQSIWDKSRFEPSGIGWIPALQKFLLVSDDTGIKDSKTDHAAYIFLMDENGKVDSEPFSLAGISTVNDLEAITAIDPETFILVSSQNISKKDKRPGNRELILKVRWDGEKFAVIHQVQFLSLLSRSYSTQQLQGLGLFEYEKDGRPVLNIEGAAFYENTLYFGLKEPVSSRGAIIWKLENIDEVFSGKKLQPDQLSVFGYISLGEHKNKPASIADMLFDHDGILWISSTIANVDNEDQLGGIHRVSQFTNGHLEAQRVLSFPGLKPEGICLYNSKQLIIAFDLDNETPLYCFLNTEAL